MRAEAKDMDGALDAARRGQALDVHADGPAILALSLFSAGVPQAEPLVLQYLAGESRFEVRMDYAAALLGKQRYAESAVQLGIVTRDKPDFAQAWLVKGTLEQQNRQWDAGARRHCCASSNCARRTRQRRTTQPSPTRP